MLFARVQSAQRSKARKLRHIMQLEEEVQTLQGLNQQHLASISSMQQEASLLCESRLSPFCTWDSSAASPELVSSIKSQHNMGQLKCLSRTSLFHLK